MSDKALLPLDGSWLGGHFREGNQVFKGSSSFCAGCGAFQRWFDVFPEGYDPQKYIPRPEPNWPYKPSNCEVCKKHDETKFVTGGSVRHGADSSSQSDRTRY